jgi:phosphoglycerate dehydrogenase-like enzyme
MTLNVGLIGVGMIGQEHINRLANKLVGAKVVALSSTRTRPRKPQPNFKAPRSIRPERR